MPDYGVHSLSTATRGGLFLTYSRRKKVYKQQLNHPHYTNEDLSQLPEKMTLEFFPIDNLAEPLTERVYEARVTVISPVGEPCIFKVEVDFLNRVEGDEKPEKMNFGQWLEFEGFSASEPEEVPNFIKVAYLSYLNN